MIYLLYTSVVKAWTFLIATAPTFSNEINASGYLIHICRLQQKLLMYPLGVNHLMSKCFQWGPFGYKILYIDTRVCVEINKNKKSSFDINKNKNHPSMYLTDISRSLLRVVWEDYIYQISVDLQYLLAVQLWCHSAF